MRAIVNVSSIMGFRGFAGQPAYTAAKHGVIGLTKAAALDHSAQGIRINAVAPGFIDTPLLGRPQPHFTRCSGSGRHHQCHSLPALGCRVLRHRRMF